MPSPDRRVSLARAMVVARREFLATVTRKGYLLSLILLPLLLGFISVLPAIAIALSGGSEELLGLKSPNEVMVIGVLDEADVVLDSWLDWHNRDQDAAWTEKRMKPLEQQPESPIPADAPVPDFVGDALNGNNRDRGGFDWDVRIQLRRYADADAARAAVRSEEVSAVWRIPGDYLATGSATVLMPRLGPLNPGIFPGHLTVARLIRRSLIDGAVSDEVATRVIRILDPTEEEISLEGEAALEELSPAESLERALQTLLPILFASFFSMMIFIASGYLLDGIGEEKENRVLEVLLASLLPEELLLGKIVGLGAAGLLQSAFFAGLGLGPMLYAGLVTISAARLGLMALFTLLGYAMFASLMGASGAVAGNRHEGRQISAVWSLSAMSPMFLLPVFLSGPGKAIPVGLSFFPLTAPIAMTLRLSLGKVPTWQLLLAIALMVGTALFAWRIGSRLFRVGILMTGARPPLKVIWRWIREG